MSNSISIAFDFSATLIQTLVLNKAAKRYGINTGNVILAIQRGEVLTTVFGNELLYVEQETGETIVIGSVEQDDYDNVEIDYHSFFLFE